MTIAGGAGVSPTTGQTVGRRQWRDAPTEEVTDQFPAATKLALAALYRGPMSADELSEYNTLRAREMARAEARRAGVTPQAVLPLDGVR